MGTRIGEFFVDLVVDAATGNLSVRQLVAAFGELESTSLGGVYGVSKIVGAMLDLAVASIDAAAGLMDLETRTGLSAQAIQKWQIAAQRANVSAATINTTIFGFQRAMAAMEMKKDMPWALQLLKIDPYLDKAHHKLKSVMAIVTEMSKRGAFWKLSPGVREAALGTIGVPSEMLLIMEKIRRGKWQKMLDEAGGITAEQMAPLTDIHNEMTEIRLLARDIGTYFLIDMEKVAHVFTFMKSELTDLLKILRASKEELKGAAQLGITAYGKELGAPSAMLGALEFIRKTIIAPTLSIPMTAGIVRDVIAHITVNVDAATGSVQRKTTERIPVTSQDMHGASRQISAGGK